MHARSFVLVFASVAACALVLLSIFNVAADRIILSSPHFGSLETVAGFERTVKPAWLAALNARVVVVGSSRVRDGFDPSLIARNLHLAVFNYGLSSITPYELRRLVQDAAAQASTQAIVVALDTFMEPGEHTTDTLSGFDEQNLAVTASGAPTPHRGLWLFAMRYLSGGASAMHAFSLYLLASLGSSKTASDRPDLFTAYRSATRRSLSEDLRYRAGRRVGLEAWKRAEFRKLLDGLCSSKVGLYLVFPPDSWAMQKIYIANDAQGFGAFKRAIEEDVQSHNAHCTQQAALFDFMLRTSITDDSSGNTLREDYSDAVHFRPPVGTRLLGFLFKNESSGIGVRLPVEASERSPAHT